MAVVIGSYPELSKAIKARLGSRKLRRMSKAKRLAYARSQGWIYQPPAAFGTKQPVTEFERTGPQPVREEGKIVATISQPQKTFEQRQADVRFEREKAQDELGSWLDTIALIVAAAIIIGVLVTSFMVGGR